MDKVDELEIEVEDDGRGQVRLVSSLSIFTCTDFVHCRAGPDEYQGLMNAVKRHVDSSVQKLETKSAEHQAASRQNLRCSRSRTLNW